MPSKLETIWEQVNPSGSYSSPDRRLWLNSYKWYEAIRAKVLERMILLFRPPLIGSVQSCNRRRIVLWGSKRSGKTAIMYRWKLGSFIPTVPTVGVLEEEMTYGKKLGLITEIGRDPLSIEKIAVINVKSERDMMSDHEPGNIIEDICCCCCRRPQLRRNGNQNLSNFGIECWIKLANSAHTIVYVVDSSCRHALIEMCDELNMILNDDYVTRQRLRVLVIANKQDVWGAVPAGDIERMLNMKHCQVLGCSALTGLNLDVALTQIFKDDIN